MIKNSVYRIYFARCMNVFNSLLAQLVKYDVHTTRKNKFDTRYFFITYYHFITFTLTCFVLFVAAVSAELRAILKNFTISVPLC